MKTARTQAGAAAFCAGVLTFNLLFLQHEIAKHNAAAGFLYAISCALLASAPLWLALDAIIIAIETPAKEPKA